MHDDCSGDAKAQAEVRAKQRAGWPISVRELGDEAPELGETTAEQRLAMMWELVVQAWAVAGKPIPDYDRAHIPMRVLTRAEADKE